MDDDSPFVRNLASSDIKTRDKAFGMLQTYLSQKTDLDSLELLKMWKGLFFSMWHCDKPRNQQQLARDFAGLIHVLPRVTVVPWLEAFWNTIAREWIGIDALRMDKYLYLVRMYLRESLQHFANEGWKDAKRLKSYCKVLKTVPLNPTSQQIPNGLRYHMIDIYVDELDALEGVDVETFPIDELLEPLRRLGRKLPEKIVRRRVKEALEDERLEQWGIKPSEDNGKSIENHEGTDANDDEWEGIQD